MSTHHFAIAAFSTRSFLAALAIALGVAPQARAGGTERASLTTAGGEANDHCIEAVISENGRFVAFQSRATNLVPGDTNGEMDLFLRDRKKGKTIRLSVGLGGVQANGASEALAISGNGRFVAFESSADNLVPGDTNGARDVFLRDWKKGVTSRVSIGPGGVQGDGVSYDPAISSDGRFVAFVSTSTNLIEGDANGASDVFVHDRKKGVTEIVSIDSAGAQGWGGWCFTPSLSGNGRFVAFATNDPALVAGDTNGLTDVFVRDRKLGTTVRASVHTTGAQANGDSLGCTLSADGRFVAFVSTAVNLVDGDGNLAQDVFVHDTKTGVTARVNVGPGGTEADNYTGLAQISASGRFVVFASSAANLDPADDNGKGDVFVHDRKKGVTTRESVSASGGSSNGSAWSPSISRDGRRVAFDSFAADLVDADTNGRTDVFVRDRKL